MKLNIIKILLILGGICILSSCQDDNNSSYSHASETISLSSEDSAISTNTSSLNSNEIALPILPL